MIDTITREELISALQHRLFTIVSVTSRGNASTRSLTIQLQVHPHYQPPYQSEKGNE